MRRDIGLAVQTYTDDFRLTCDGDELDQDLPFNQQGLVEGAQLTGDLQIILKINFTETNETTTLKCFSSDSVGHLRQRLNCDDDTALVSLWPYRRVLDDSLRVCHIVEEPEELEAPTRLLPAERKVMRSFEPITAEHLRQKLPVALSSTPLDIYDLVSAKFRLSTEFRLAAYGQPLDNCKTLLEQLIDIDDVIQIDIVRPFIVSDLWKGLMEEASFEKVYLYSTESSYALYARERGQERGQERERERERTG